MRDKRMWMYVQYLLENLELNPHERAQLLVSQDCIITGALDPYHWVKIKQLGLWSQNTAEFHSSRIWLDLLKESEPTAPIKTFYPKLQLV